MIKEESSSIHFLLKSVGPIDYWEIPGQISLYTNPATRIRGDINNHPHPSPLPPAGEGKIRTSFTGRVYSQESRGLRDL